ncbi:MAG TPA: hypothetical protein VFQ05_12345 [Candidatus Eisenbacteria bacterium]|nr:hypothetical protein [Candidatus Eisenbacteria bacterium]
MALVIQTTPVGGAIAAALVVAGASMFGAGLRSLRLRRQLSRLEVLSPGDERTGFGRVEGRVALESPLVGPLSGQPCAGYRLEVLGPRSMRLATLDDLRPFRLIAESGTAHVAGVDGGTWDLPVVAQRGVAPADELSENLRALLHQSPEAQWMRRAGMTVTLVERALRAGESCCVIGAARPAQPYELISDVELARTGTDDAPLSALRRAQAPELWIEPDPQLQYLRISLEPPPTATLAVSPWRTLGLIAGPLLSLAGMIYLMALADALRALTRFVR